MNNPAKILVIGSVGNEKHENSCRDAALAQFSTAQVDIAEIGNGTPNGNIVTYQPDIAHCVSYAIANSYDAITRSYVVGYEYEIEWSEAWEAGILVCHAHDGNDHNLYPNPATIWDAAVWCGAGSTENETSYGPGIEFFDHSATNLVAPFYESFSTPVIASKILQIAIAKGCSIKEARYIYARNTASCKGIWNQNDGFGIIDVNTAIACQIPAYTRIIKGKV